MNSPDLPEQLRARMAELAAMPALETARGFLGGVVGDAESLGEVRADLAQVAQISTRAHHRYLAALETVLSEEQPPGTLLELVAGYGGWSLDHDPTDSGAAVFLTGLVEMLRDVIDEADKQAPQP
jgi:hypothetical protein